MISNLEPPPRAPLIGSAFRSRLLKNSRVSNPRNFRVISTWGREQILVAVVAASDALVPCLDDLELSSKAWV